MIRVLLLLVLLGAPVVAQSYKCAPPDVGLDEVASAELLPSKSSSGKVEKVTIRQKLNSLKARCSGNRLVDRSGREIRIYRRIGCWGNPPENYMDILQHQREEIARLKKKYSVIEISCNSSGFSPP